MTYKIKSLGSRVSKVQKSTLLKASPILVLTILTLTFFTAQALESGDRVRVDSSTLEWVEPFQHDLSSMPVDYGSGQEPEVGIDFKKSSVNNPDEINYLYKKASEKTFTEVEQQPIFSRYHHVDSQNDADYDNTVYWYEDTDSFTVDEGNSNTFFIDGGEHTVNVEGINSENQVDINYDGVSYNNLRIGESIDAVSSGNDHTLVIDDISTTYSNVDFEVFDNEFKVGDGHYRLIAMAKEDGKHQYSKPLYFDTTSDSNIPFIQKVTYNGKKIDHLNELTDVATNGEFRVFVRNNEKDDYTFKLVDRDQNQVVQSVNVNDNTLQSILQAVVNEFFGIFYEEQQLTQGGDVAEIPLKITGSTSLLNSISTTENIGFRIEGPDGTRKSPNYTITPNQNNADPTVNKIQFTESCSNPVTFIDISLLKSRDWNPECIVVDVDDPDTTGGHAVSLNLTQEYDGMQHEFTTDLIEDLGDSDKIDGNKYFFKISNFNRPFDKIEDSGTWNVTAVVKEGSSRDSKTVSWQVPWGNLNVEMQKPSSDLTKNNSESFEMDLTISCSGGPECVNQNESANLYWDPAKKSVKKESEVES